MNQFYNFREILVHLKYEFLNCLIRNYHIMQAKNIIDLYRFYKIILANVHVCNKVDAKNA